VVNGIDNDGEGESSEENEIPALIDIVEGDENWVLATSMEVISPITWEYLDERAIMEQEFMRRNANCGACGECRPRIVAEYCIT
jgi:hypothetical protein